MFDFPALEQAARGRVRGKRLNHVLRVTEAAMRLAVMHQVDRERARAAGLLHDYARDVPDHEMLDLARRLGLNVDPVESQSPGALLHAAVGAALLEQEGVLTDREVLDAIRYHTTGAPQMSRLARLVWIADLVEPGRNFAGVEVLRALADTDLDLAVAAGLDHTLAYLIHSGRVIHPMTVAARNWLLGEVAAQGKAWPGYRLPG